MRVALGTRGTTHDAAFKTKKSKSLRPWNLRSWENPGNARIIQCAVVQGFIDMDDLNVLKDTLRKLDEHHSDNPASVGLKQILTEKIEKLERQGESDSEDSDRGDSPL